MKFSKILAGFLAVSFIFSGTVFASNPPVAVNSNTESSQETSANDENIYTIETNQKNQNFLNTLYDINPYTIEGQDPTSRGVLPEISVVSNPDYENSLNKIVNDFYDMAIEKALKQNVRVSFVYEVFESGGYLNFGIFAKYGVGATAGEDVITIVVATEYCKIFTLQDILGPNAYEMTTQFVKNIIANENSDIFDNGKNFKGVKPSTPFYFLDETTIGLVYSKDFIADSDSSIVFMVDLLNVYKSILTKSETNNARGTVNVPIRKVAEDLGYTVVWDEENKTVTLSNEYYDDIVIAVDANDYLGQELENAPEYIFGKVFVPTTFFSEILGCFVNIEETTGNVVINQI